MSDPGIDPSGSSAPCEPRHDHIDLMAVAVEDNKHNKDSTKPTINLKDLEYRALNLRLDLDETQIAVSNDEENKWLQELSGVALELYRIYTHIKQLKHAMATRPSCYSDAFRQDLYKNWEELNMTFDEIEECHQLLEKTNNDTLVPWFFRKGRVDRLIKHLCVMKTQLKIMNVVIEDASREPDNDDEATPMSQNRNILEAALMANHEKIRDIYKEDENSNEEQCAAAAGATRQNHYLPDAACNVGLQDTLLAIGEHDDEAEEVALVPRRFTARLRAGQHAYMPSTSTTNQALRARWLKHQSETDQPEDNLTFHPYRRIPTTFDEIFAGAPHGVAAARSPQHKAAGEGAGRVSGRRLSAFVKEKIRGSFVGKAVARVRRAVSGGEEKEKEKERT